MNQFQPPPRPPQARVLVDPLMALSETKAAPSAEELTDLSDEDMEQWALGGTRILTKPTPTPAPVSAAPVSVLPTMHQAPNHPSYYPVSLPSVPPRPAQKSHLGLWLALASVLVLIFGVVAAAIGFIVYRAHTDEVAAVTVPPPPPVETAAAVTAPPVVTAAPTATPIATANASANANANAHATPTATTRTTSSHAPAVTATGILRTFAAGNGKPISVDGRQIGYGGSGPTTTCGKHSIAVGTGRARTYDVPCNGSITVGSPDGN